MWQLSILSQTVALNVLGFSECGFVFLKTSFTEKINLMKLNLKMLTYSVLICIYINFPEIVTQHKLFFA